MKELAAERASAQARRLALFRKSAGFPLQSNESGLDYALGFCDDVIRPFGMRS